MYCKREALASIKGLVRPLQEDLPEPLKWSTNFNSYYDSWCLQLEISEHFTEAVLNHTGCTDETEGLCNIRLQSE